MKKVILKLTLVIVTTLFFFSCGKDDQGNDKSLNCLPASLQNGVLAFYTFSNGTMNDSSGNNRNLTNTSAATATTDRNNNQNCAFVFDNLPASNEFLSTTDTAFLNALPAFSISLWYMPLDNSRPDGDFEDLISRGNTPSCPDRYGDWSVGLYDCRRAVFGRTTSVWELNPTNACDVAARTGSWHHVVATYNQANNDEMIIYRDGILQETDTGISNCQSGPPTVTNLGDLFIGLNYTGKLDDIIIYDKTLDQAEVNSLLNMAPCCIE